MSIVHTSCMTTTRLGLIHTGAACVIAAAAALSLGDYVGSVVHGQDSTTTEQTTTDARPDTTDVYALGKTISKDVTWEADCTEIAVWSAVVDTHGPDAAAQVWRKLVLQGWTNPASGDVLVLIPAGCAY